jgi:hypothetical protein
VSIVSMSTPSSQFQAFTHAAAAILSGVRRLLIYSPTGLDQFVCEHGGYPNARAMAVYIRYRPTAHPSASQAYDEGSIPFTRSREKAQ